ncbi:hypothetical protein [Spirosoma sp.]|uniref:hypothetical protein n=1 Tax=Spirosoma sp. TaxID=1899569 RepID=UPI00260790DA|nr:hypothetical protein [Spirosoma sp.]MCX6217605.1 hypothetical protein [Spirosoma sp.]
MDEIDEIEQLDADLLLWETEVETGVRSLNEAVLSEVDGFLDGRAGSFLGPKTTSADWSDNMRAVTYFNAGLTAMIYRVGFLSLLSGLVERIKESARRMDAYYAKIQPGYQSATYATVVNQLTEQTRALVATAAEQTYGKLVGESLMLGTLTKSTGAELRRTIREKLKNEGLAVRPLSTNASESLYISSRAYMQSVAENERMKYYYYMGTAVAGSRSFCLSKKGKAFTQAEVESWPNQTWAGKIPGTNKQSIFWYCGGYRCRDRLLPISKTMYKTLKANE